MQDDHTMTIDTPQSSGQPPSSASSGLTSLAPTWARILRDIAATGLTFYALPHVLDMAKDRLLESWVRATALGIVALMSLPMEVGQGLLRSVGDLVARRGVK